jgi:glycine cleavage system H protein
MEIPKDLKYARTHEWVRVEDDVVYVEMPASGDSYKKGEEAATVESVKAASAIYTPVAGTVAEVNPDLEGSPELINQKPYEAFIFAIRFSDAAGLEDLLDSAAYEKHVEQEKENH